MITRLCNLITRTLCFHQGPQLIRASRTQLYLECMACGRTTHGIEVEGF